MSAALTRAFVRFDRATAYGTAARQRPYAPAAMLSAWEEYQALQVQFGGTRALPPCAACGDPFRCVCGVRD